MKYNFFSPEVATIEHRKMSNIADTKTTKV